MTASPALKDRGTTISAAAARQRLLADTALAERTLRLTGISTAVLEGGDGAPILLLHGPGEHALKWMTAAPALARAHRVIAPDLPGHGSTQVLEGVLDVDRVLAWLDALIDATCSSPPAIVGSLSGGAIALRYAMRHGRRLTRLVLVDTLGLAPLQPAPQFASALMQFLESPNAGTYDELWRYCAHDVDALRNAMGERWEVLKTYNLDRATQPRLRAEQQRLMELFAFPAIPAEELATIRTPVHLIWGREDLATPLSVAQAASERHGWPLQVIDGSGDEPTLEKPEAFLAALDRALAG
jgi:pimeloyl-ACP methyl ester carboxylesterase